MRKALMLLCGVTIMAGMAASPVLAAQGGDAQNITHGEFAQLLLQALATRGAPSATPAAALAKVQELDLMPSEWKADTVMTHGDLAVVMGALGISYVPPDEGDPVSVPFANAILRRYADEIKHTRGTLFLHSFADSDYMDRGVDRAVSPGNF